MADQKITQLSEQTSITNDDLFVVVENTSGATKKVQAQNILPAGSVGTADIADANVTTAKIADGNITSAKVAAGVSVQTVSTNYSAVSTGTTILPVDDTIPQITEGNEFMTQAITPKSATNRIVIEATVLASHSASAENIAMALFQDATTNALAATDTFQGIATGMVNLKLAHDMAAGTTSSTTFRIRVGGSQAGTTTFNGQAGARKFGGITLSNIKITEYKV